MPKSNTAADLACAVLAALLALSCAPKTVDRAPPLPAQCPPQGERDVVRWFQVGDPGEREELLRWCAAVGPPVVESGPAAPAAVVIDSMVVITWNTHVGGGSLGYFIRQLRTGVLTGGRPVRNFVVLLQEAYREGYDVPAELPAGGLYASDIFPRRELGVRRGIRQVASEEGLHAFYVPAMRNGIDRVPPEDRGNAILSTLPLTDYTAWELPLRYQRRVTVGATVSGETSDGRPWQLTLVDVHLDNRSGLQSLVQSFTRARVRQTEFLLDHIPQGGAAVLGGDLNTWLGEAQEPAVRLIRESFTVPADLPSHGTLKFGAILERQTDFLFFRLPAGWRARYRRVGGTYGSDHYPLLGWVVFGTPQLSKEGG
jgi:endonuclease/exonuclease/phosphatase family metal-dependent hydrolase